MSTIAIRKTDPTAPDVRALVDELDAYSQALYPPESNHLDPVEELAKTHVYFVGAYDDDTLIGCGAVKIMPDGYGEIKRFMQEQDIAPLGVDIFTPDFSLILAGYGWGYKKVSDLDSLRALLANPAEGNELIEIDEATLVASLTRMDNAD